MRSLQVMNIQPEAFNIAPTGVNVQPQGLSIGPTLIVIGPYDTTVAGQVRSYAAVSPQHQSCLLCASHTRVLFVHSLACRTPAVPNSA